MTEEYDLPTDVVEALSSMTGLPEVDVKLRKALNNHRKRPATLPAENITVDRVYRTPNGMHVRSERGFPDGLPIDNGGNIDGQFPLSVWPEPEPTVGLLNDGWVARRWSEIPEDWLILSTSRVAFKRGDDTGGSRPGGLWTGYVLCRPPVDKTDDGESE